MAALEWESRWRYPRHAVFPGPGLDHVGPLKNPLIANRGNRYGTRCKVRKRQIHALLYDFSSSTHSELYTRRNFPEALRKGSPKIRAV